MPGPTAPSPAPSLGTKVDDVVVEISYDIIEHFSEHTYGTPEKAIEELVVNGYDAFAHWVRVYLPSDSAADCYVVWDDGTSMDVEHLKALWHIARSPKKGSSRVIERDGASREVIGKFGIGKLASYTLGNSIAHLCRRDDTFLLVQVRYSRLQEDLPKNGSGVGKHTTAILRLTEEEARSYLAERFDEVPTSFDAAFDEPTWTAAIVGELRDDASPLRKGMLRRVLGNAMPLRPDFEVEVEEEEVTPTLAKGDVLETWDLGSKQVLDQLRSLWKKAVTSGDVSNEYETGERVGLDPTDATRAVPYVEFPNLGVVWGTATLFEKPLQRTRASELGRSHGFFVMVKGRLVNGTDPQLFLADPSFGAFYRSQYVVHADGLDAILLASRERLREDSPLSRELRVLQQAMYLVTRTRNTEEEEAKMEEASLTSRIPTYSRDHYLDPLSAYWAERLPQEELEFDPSDPPVEKVNLTPDGPLADIQLDGFKLNLDHPYYAEVAKAFSATKKLAPALVELEGIALGERIFEGYLLAMGLPDETVKDIVDWRDRYYRLQARRKRPSLAKIIEDLRDTSKQSGTPFEAAIEAALEHMGYIARRDGASGEKDVLAIAAAYDSPYRFTMEAKGTTQAGVANDDAEVGGAVAHRDAVGAAHAVIVAKKFKGFGKGDENPAILKECTAAGGVSIMEVDALVALLKVMDRYHYELDNEAVLAAFTAVETPAAKLERIGRLEVPLESFDYPKLLGRIWERQGNSRGRDIPIKELYRDFYEDDGAIDEQTFHTKIQALQTLAYPLIQYEVPGGNTEFARIALRQSPTNIASRIGEVIDAVPSLPDV